MIPLTYITYTTPQRALRDNSDGMLYLVTFIINGVRGSDDCQSGKITSNMLFRILHHFSNYAVENRRISLRGCTRTNINIHLLDDSIYCVYTRRKIEHYKYRPERNAPREILVLNK